MNRYPPARQYMPASLAAAVLGVFSAWCAGQWPLAFLPAGLFALSASLMLYLATRPTIEISEAGLQLGARRIRWRDIERVDSTAWNSPLVLHLILRGGERIRLVYPGDVAAADRLLRRIRRFATRALLDGTPHGEFWGEAAPIRAGASGLGSPRYRLLPEQDEEEVERLYRRLKAVGRIDRSSSSEERGD